jgi:putative two-component system response regulator
MEKNTEQRYTILVADDSDMNRFMLRNMLEESYDIIEAEDGLQAVELLQKQDTEISLVLLDIVMPNLDGFGVLAAMNKNQWIESTPVIMISAENTQSYIERAYELGVTDYISRPFDVMVVRQRVINTIMLYAKQKRLVAMVADQIYQKEKSNNLMISILSHIVEFRNAESGLHVIHIQTMTEILLKCLAGKTNKYKLDREKINLISMASALHDVGKIAIPTEVLNKPGRLTKEEFEVIKQHPVYGADMLRDVPGQGEPLVKYAYEICRWHHERYDGRGYPDGLAGEEIPISAQVVALADVYDALTSERVYKPAFTHEKALEMITNNECGTFQPLLLECLMESGDEIRQEMELHSLGRSDQHALESVAAELLQHKELSTTDRTMRLLEHERIKYQFYAAMSQEVQFEFTLDPLMLRISKLGAQRLGLEETIADPADNIQVLKIFGEENLAQLTQAVRATTPEDPVAHYECEILIGGQLRWSRVICRSMWSEEDPPEYTGVIGKVLDIHDERTRMIELEHRASHDSLTGLLNHGAAQEEIQMMLDGALNKEFAMAIVDLDHFKQINDQRGHIFGDQVLKYMAQKLSQSIRRGDIAARVGGDEFLIFLACNDNLETVVDRIFHSICGEYQGIPLSLSMGIARSDSGDRTYEGLLHRADQALYAVKRQGRGHYRFHDSTMDEMLSVLSPIESSGRLKPQQTEEEHV